MRIGAVLFDLDGTITDSAPGIVKSVQYALNRLGIAEETIGDLRSFVGPPLEESFREKCGLEKSDAWLAVELYREYFNDHGIYENSVYEGMGDLLKGLHDDGFVLALTTAKPTFYARQILTHFNLMDCFEVVVGSHMDGGRTDKRELIEATLGLLTDAARQGAVMVGDRAHDVLGAKKMGLKCVGVMWGYGTTLELAGATWQADTVKDLERFLRGQK